MDEDGIKNFGCDFDEKRRRFWQSVVDYVNLAWENHYLNLIMDENLCSFATSIISMGDTWSKTCYFFTVHGYS